MEAATTTKREVSNFDLNHVECMVCGKVREAWSWNDYGRGIGQYAVCSESCDALHRARPQDYEEVSNGRRCPKGHDRPAHFTVLGLDDGYTFLEVPHGFEVHCSTYPSPKAPAGMVCWFPTLAEAKAAAIGHWSAAMDAKMGGGEWVKAQDLKPRDRIPDRSDYPVKRVEVHDGQVVAHVDAPESAFDPRVICDENDPVWREAQS